MFRIVRLACAAALALVCAGAAVAEEVPTTKLLTAPLVSPSTAWTYYGSGTTHTSGAAATVQRPPEIKALAKGLGSERIGQPAGNGGLTAAEYNQKVYDYVRHNIATEFRFGLSKGARGVLIDQSGTAFDQAELMVELLREGGMTASYKVGTITLNAQEFGQWAGLIKDLNQSAQTFTVSARAACQMLADGAIPATVNGQSDCNNTALNTASLTTVTLGHIWVAANGVLYDPAYKKHAFKAGVDVAAALQCGTASAPTCGAGAEAAAITGSTSSTIGGAPARTDVKEATLNGLLQDRAEALETHIKTNLPTAELGDVIGGKDVDTAYSPALGAALPYTSSVQYTWTGAIPDKFRTTLRVRYWQIDQTFFADEIAGKRLRIFTPDQDTAVLKIYVDDLGVTTPACTSCVDEKVILNVDHPYASSSGAYADETANLDLTMGTLFAAPPLTIVHGFGVTSPAAEQHYANLQAASPNPLIVGIDPVGAPFATPYCGTNAMYGVSGPFESCRNDSQPAMVAKLLSQGSTAERALAAMTGSSVSRHHSIGVLASNVYSPGTSLVFSIQSAISVNARDANATNRKATFDTAAAVWGMLEGSVNQQSSDTETPHTAASLLVISNRQSIPLINVAAGNMATVLPSLIHYAGERGDRLQAMDSAGYSAIIAKDARPTGTNYTVNGSLFYSADASLYMVNENFKGGGAIPGPQDPAQSALDAAKQSDYGLNKKKSLAVSESSGVLTLKPAADLVTGAGGFPYALPFQRQYQSGGQGEANGRVHKGVNGTFSPNTYLSHVYGGPDADVFGRIGGEWTHNYGLSARIGSNGLKGMGADSGLDAADFVAGLFTLYDSFKGTSFERRLTSLFVSNWIGDQFIRNAVTVDIAGNSETFLRLPSGGFSPPARASSKVVQTGAPVLSAVSLSSGVAYDYASVSLTYTSESGAVIAFTPSLVQTGYSCIETIGCAYHDITSPVFKADSWLFPDGVKLTFTYESVFWGAKGGVGSSYFQDQGYTEAKVLKTVSNNLGRSLTFTNDLRHMGAVITKVTDETGRHVDYALSDCPDFSTSKIAFACGGLTVTLPTGDVVKYDYEPGTDSPDPAVSYRPTYRLRRWYVPSDQSNAFAVVRYDDLMRVRETEDALAHKTQYYAGGVGANERYMQAQARDALGKVSSSLFDERGSLLSSTDPLGRKTSYSYDSAGRKVRTILPEGNQERLTYDVRSNVTETRFVPKPGSTLPEIVKTATYGEGVNVRDCANYKTCNEPASESDARGKTTSYSWSASTGQLTQVLKPAPGGSGTRPQIDLTYSQIGPVGNQFSMLTAKTEKISGTAGDELKTSYAYNSANKYVLQTSTVDSGTGGLALATGFTFDAIGNVTQVDGPRTDVADVSNFVWDTNRRLTYAIQADPDGAGAMLRPATKYTYDIDGQLIRTEVGKTSASDGSSFTALKKVEYAYDDVGNKLREIAYDGVGATRLKLTQYSYDANDRALCILVRMNPGGTLPTDACTLGTTGGQGLDRITKTIYDDAGQVTKTIRAFGDASLQQDYATYSYTPNGKQATVQDANYNLTTLEYDGFDRLVKQRFPSTTRPGTPSAATSSTTDYEEYAYDAAGNRTSLRKRDGSTIAFTYDDLNRETVKDIPGGTSADVYTAYDLMGRKLSAKFVSTGGTGIVYTYDRTGRQLTETDSAASRTLTYEYDKAGNRTKVTYPGGTSLYAGYVYDPLNRVTAINENGATSGTGLLTTFVYDQLGRRTDLNRGNTAATDYGFDNLDRLTSLLQDLSSTANDNTFTLTYNPAGQAITRLASNDAYQWTPSVAVTKNYTHNGLNQDAAIAAVGGACGPTGGYDCNGNLLRDGTRTFAYDVENRLVSANDGSTTLALAYDPLGRLKQTTAASTTTQFLYDGDRLVAEYNGSTILRRYVHGTGTDEPLVWYEGSALSDKRWLHHDTQGSVIATSVAAGAVGDLYKYGPYGEPQNDNWSGARFRYTGQIALPETKLYYYKARVYDPAIGRFLQTDPIGYQDDPNLYAYVGNDPINHADPTGNCVDGCVVEAAIGIGVIGTYLWCTVFCEDTAEQIAQGVQTILNEVQSPSDKPKREEAGTSKGSGEKVSDRPAGADGKKGSTGGPGAGKRFPAEKPDVKKAKEGKPCQYCERPTTNKTGQPNSRERDHIDPKSRGGNNSPENERDACRTCNRGKRDRNPDEWQPPRIWPFN